MTSKIKYTYGMNDQDIAAGITSVGKRHKSLYADIQFLAVSIIHAFHKSGDGQTATRRANGLIAAIANGKQNSLRRWFETQAPMVFNKDTKELVVGHSPASPVKDYKAINALASKDVQWFDSIPDPEYKPMADLGGQIMQLVKRAKEDIARLGDKSKVNPAQLAALESLLAVPAKAGEMPVVTAKNSEGKRIAA